MHVPGVLRKEKISIIGAGNVGATSAFEIARRDMGNITLVDIADGIPQGRALDIQHSMPLFGSSSRISGTTDFSEIRDSDVIVIAAGRARKPGMTREDLLGANAKIVKDICSRVKELAPNSVVIMVTNPIDIICYIAYKELGFPRERVLGMAGLLDTARFRAFIAMETKVPPDKIEAVVLGSHGDTMVPVLEHTKVKGRPLKDVLSPEKIHAIVERTRKAGGEIVSLLKTGSASFAPAVSISEMVSAVTEGSRATLPVSVLLEGEYGHEGIFLGVPARLGKSGLQRVVELQLDTETREQLDRSANIIKNLMKSAGL